MKVNAKRPASEVAGAVTDGTKQEAVRLGVESSRKRLKIPQDAEVGGVVMLWEGLSRTEFPNLN